MFLRLKSSNIFGFLKSKPTITVFFSLKAKTVPILVAQKDFPSPLTDDVSIKVLAPTRFCFLYKNCKEERIARKDSAIADLGFSKTARLLLLLINPITPITGILVSCSISSVLCMLLSVNVKKNANNKGIKIPKNSAKT